MALEMQLRPDGGHSVRGISLLPLYVRLQALKDTLVRDESGQDLVEYALVATLIALAATAGMPALANAIRNAFIHIGTKLATYTS
jgi:pilus assembly protein Flp/PilA